MTDKNRKKLISFIAAVILAVYSFSLFTVFADSKTDEDNGSGNELVGGGVAVTGQAEGVGYAAMLYNADNGLPTSEANTVYAAPDGFIWVGGYSGLLKYDGTTFERQDPSTSITSVNTVFEDSTGRLWVGTNDNGVICLVDGVSYHYSYDEGLDSSSICSFAEDMYGNILIGTKQGVYYYNGQGELKMIYNPRLIDAYVIQLKNCPNGSIVGLTKNGAIFRVKELEVTDYYNASELGIDTVTAILPSIIIFDSLDDHVHSKELDIRNLCYFEYCVIKMDGNVEIKGARKSAVERTKHSRDYEGSREILPNNVTVYDIETVRIKDHVSIKIDDGNEIVEVVIALPDSSRYAYVSFTGEYCRISDIEVIRNEVEMPESYIKRIAPEVTYIDGPRGDMPNIQVDGFRTKTSRGIVIEDGLTFSFHAMSLPTARLIWHCPYFVIFSSDNGRVNGENYKEYALIRLDGEYWEPEGNYNNNLMVHKRDSFPGWNKWKEACKEGIDSSISFTREGYTITATTENLGIYIKDVLTVIDENEPVYVALTGDQVALTNIRISVDPGSKSRGTEILDDVRE